MARGGALSRFSMRVFGNMIAQAGTISAKSDPSVGAFIVFLLGKEQECEKDGELCRSRIMSLKRR